MPYKPFLSHKHEDAGDLAVLRQQLVLRGAGSWQDVDELRMGQRWKAAFRRAIGRETGGFIWWATPAALRSWTILHVEVPAALRRTRRRRGKPYPFVPLMVGLSPDSLDDIEAIHKAFGKRRAAQILNRQGLVRQPGEDIADFSARAAHRYVRDLIREHGDRELRIAVTGGREPTRDHDLCLDWRPLLDADGRPADADTISTLARTLSDIRAAAQSTGACPHLIVEPHLRLPLAVLVGWEWNRVQQVKLTIVQPSPLRELIVEDIVVPGRDWPDVRSQVRGGSGPAVLAVSVGKDLGDGVGRYADTVNANELTHLHVALDDYPQQALGAEDICALAQWTVKQLSALNARGVEKHLLLLGPVSLAARVGGSANGTGRTFVPFWDGGAGYTAGVLIG